MMTRGKVIPGHRERNRRCDRDASVGEYRQRVGHRTSGHDAKSVSRLLAQRMELLVSRLGLCGKREGKELIALNPKRADRTPRSFRINLATGFWADFATGDKGDALDLVCFLATNGDKRRALQWATEFLGLAGGAAGPRDRTAKGLTLEEYARAKGLNVEFLKSLGLQTRSDARGTYVAIPYFNATGQHIATRQRFALDGPNRFRWRGGDKPVLYGLDRLAGAREQGFVVIVEGESDVHTLHEHGFPAVGLPGANNWNEARDARELDGIEKVFVVCEGDEGGEAVMRWLAASSIRHRALLLNFSEPLKDPNALLLRAGTEFKREFSERLAAAVPWARTEAERTSKRAEVALNECHELAHAPDILSLFRSSLKNAGLVGEDRNACLLYLALTSRLLHRICSVAYKGPSSGGKSFTVDRVLTHFPEAAYIRLSGMSERALVYMEEDVAHRHIVLAEADGAGERQDYFLRTLLSEGRLEYRLAEKTSDGIRERVISKEGPCGLVVTTTRVKLHAENETRLISLTANDTPEQTRAVLQSIASARDVDVDGFKRWRALQEWLALGEHRVAIPYAPTLAGLVSDGAVRMRRDFRQLISLIEAHALLHRATRRRDGTGSIIATLADYETVRGLVFDLLAEGVSATVSREVREAVEAVRDLAGETGVGLQPIAARLNLDKSSTSRRCAAARSAGHIINEETRKGREARYRIGDPMPADRPVLPTVDELQTVFDAGSVGVRPREQRRKGAMVGPSRGDRCSIAAFQ